MSTHVAFLRGMNVGGHRLTNVELVAVVSALGHADVSAYQASGNVLFTPTDGSDDDSLERKLEAHLEEGLGYAVPAFVRTADEVQAIVARELFPTAPDGSKEHVAFLREPIPANVRAGIDEALLDTDEIAATDRELHWLVGTGSMMESALGDPAVARLMGDRWTVRTAGTVERIASKLAA